MDGPLSLVRLQEFVADKLLDLPRIPSLQLSSLATFLQKASHLKVWCAYIWVILVYYGLIFWFEIHRCLLCLCLTYWWLCCVPQDRSVRNHHCDMAHWCTVLLSSCAICVDCQQQHLVLELSGCVFWEKLWIPHQQYNNILQRPEQNVCFSALVLCIYQWIMW